MTAGNRPALSCASPHRSRNRFDGRALSPVFGRVERPDACHAPSHIVFATRTPDASVIACGPMVGATERVLNATQP